MAYIKVYILDVTDVIAKCRNTVASQIAKAREEDIYFLKIRVLD